MDQVWEKGGGKGEVPINYSLNIEKNVFKQVYKFQIEETTKALKYEFKDLKQKQDDVISLKSDFTLKMQVAKSFRNIDVMFIDIFNL